MSLFTPDKLRDRTRHLSERASRMLKSAPVSEAVEHDSAATYTLIPTQKFERPKMAYETKLKNKTVDLSEAEPVLKAEQVKEVYGVDFGSLAAVIELPAPEWYGGGYGEVKPKLVYVFTQPSASNPDAKAEATHFVMGQRSLDALHTASITGDPVDESLTHDVLTLSKGQNEEVVIGREGWLPELAYNTGAVNTDPTLHEQYKTVSRSQVMLSINSAGGLELADLNSHNGTMAYYGAPIES